MSVSFISGILSWLFYLLLYCEKRIDKKISVGVFFALISPIQDWRDCKSVFSPWSWTFLVIRCLSRRRKVTCASSPSKSSKSKWVRELVRISKRFVPELCWLRYEEAVKGVGMHGVFTRIYVWGCRESSCFLSHVHSLLINTLFLSFTYFFFIFSLTIFRIFVLRSLIQLLFSHTIILYPFRQLSHIFFYFQSYGYAYIQTNIYT